MITKCDSGELPVVIKQIVDHIGDKILICGIFLKLDFRQKDSPSPPADLHHARLYLLAKLPNSTATSTFVRYAGSGGVSLNYRTLQDFTFESFRSSPNPDVLYLNTFYRGTLATILVTFQMLDL
jgi:hypothetical protein